jgi:hypothetical protein
MNAPILGRFRGSAVDLRVDPIRHFEPEHLGQCFGAEQNFGSLDLRIEDIRPQLIPGTSDGQRLDESGRRGT